MINRIRRRPQRTRRWCVILPAHVDVVEKVGHGFMVEAGIDGFRLAVRFNQLHRRSRGGNASADRGVIDRRLVHILSIERAYGIVGRAGRRSSSENKLMRGKTRPLIGLKHVIRPPVRGRQAEVGIQYPAVAHVPELRFARASSGAGIARGSVHLAGPGGVHVAHGSERLVRVGEIVVVGEQDRGWVRGAGGRRIVQPFAGLNVILRTGWICAAR